MLLVTACSNDEHDDLLSQETDLRSSEIVTFSQDMDGVSVLIFGKNDANQFIYKRKIDSGWSPEGKVSTDLEIGYYKFLFLKSAGLSTSMSPTPSAGNTNFNDIRIMATADGSNPGCVLPVDEIWLPETFSMANEEYEILSPTTVQNTIKRVVSQIELTVKMGYLNGNVFEELPYDNLDVMKNIKEIQFDITGLGEAVNIAGSIGSTAKTIYKTAQARDVTTKGAATFDGPFVFPPAGANKTNVVITIVPKDDSPYPAMVSKTITERLERNQKLAITLWITDTYQFFDVTVETAPISQVEDGDEGIWE